MSSTCSTVASPYSWKRTARIPSPWLRINATTAFSRALLRGNWWDLPDFHTEHRAPDPAGLRCERGLEVGQHTELGEDDRSFRVAVEPDDLAVLVEFEDVGARGVHLLSSSRQFTEGQLQRTVVGALTAELAMHVGERGCVIADRFGEVAAAVGCSHGIVGEFTIGGEQRDPAFEVFAFGDLVCVANS